MPLALWRRWGLATLGALAALPAADLFERLGAAGLAWHAMARGLDARPLVPTAEPQPFEATCAFEWPIEAIEPLSFALGRVIDPLCARLDHDGLGTVTLQTTLRLVTRELYVRRLGLPMPMRDPRVLRTLIVLDLESHPPPAGIDVLTVTFEPVAGRIVQPSLLARAHPRPETIATLTARLRAVMGDGRVGRPVALDTHRGGAIGMRPFDGPAAGLPLAVAETPSTAARDPAGAGRLTLRRFRPAAAGAGRARSRAAGARAIARAAAAAAARGGAAVRRSVAIVGRLVAGRARHACTVGLAARSVGVERRADHRLGRGRVGRRLRIGDRVAPRARSTTRHVGRRRAHRLTPPRATPAGPPRVG